MKFKTLKACDNTCDCCEKKDNRKSSFCEDEDVTIDTKTLAVIETDIGYIPIGWKIDYTRNEDAYIMNRLLCPKCIIEDNKCPSTDEPIVGDRYPLQPAFCTCKNEYGHQWNASNTRLICAKCKKFV